MSLPDAAIQTKPGLRLEWIQDGLLWLMVAFGWLVIIEPSPSDMLFVPVLLIFAFSGLRIHLTAAPLILLLLLYNIGGFVSFLEVSNQTKATFFVITSTYMSISAIFFALAIPADPMRRMAIIRNAWIIAATIGAINGMIGYFNLFGLGPSWAPIARAQGTFKDPNVLSTFLLAPAVFIIQGFLLGTQKWRVLSAICLLIILAGLFLAFSRGAWISFVGCTVLLFVITFIVSETRALRSRIVILGLIGVIGAAIMLALLLSIPQVRELFVQRFSLLQSYDSGETGRFGNQLRAIPFLLERPFGFGPTQFRQEFGADPHNVYINAFSSYGWLGGISYPLLCISTMIIGWKVMFTRTPWQNHAIAVFLPLFTTILQGVQIDTDHWRHFYTLLGITWGLFGATVIYERQMTGGRPELRR